MKHVFDKFWYIFCVKCSDLTEPSVSRAHWFITIFKKIFFSFFRFRCWQFEVMSSSINESASIGTNTLIQSHTHTNTHICIQTNRKFTLGNTTPVLSFFSLHCSYILIMALTCFGSMNFFFGWFWIQMEMEKSWHIKLNGWRCGGCW